MSFQATALQRDCVRSSSKSTYNGQLVPWFEFLSFGGWDPLQIHLLSDEVQDALLAGFPAYSRFGFKLTRDAFGPHARQPSVVHLVCQTHGFARRIRDWFIDDYSLRDLGW